MKLKALELFAGIGGIALAEQMAGIDVVGLSEIEAYPAKVLKKNFPSVPILKDVRQINRESLRKEGIDANSINIVSGGFPCQPYSTAGKRRGKEDDRDLWPEMFRIIKELKPRWVVGENVANFVNMELDRTLFDLESIGYETETFVLPACGVDAKHKRVRTFIVANAYSMRKLQLSRSIKTFGNGISKCCQAMDNTDSDRRLASRKNKYEKLEKNQSKWQSSSTSCTPAKWSSEPRVGRVANGVPNRMDRLKCLGNAVVPEQILPIFKAIVEIEKGAN